jgi:hypothetical protein
MLFAPFDKKIATEIATSLKHYLGEIYIDDNERLNIVHTICVCPFHELKRIELCNIYTDHVNGGVTTVEAIRDYLETCGDVEYDVVAVVEQQCENYIFVKLIEVTIVSNEQGITYGFHFSKSIKIS